jgi:hypothetical protein
MKLMGTRHAVVCVSETFRRLFISVLLLRIITWHRVAYRNVIFMYNGAQ